MRKVGVVITRKNPLVSSSNLPFVFLHILIIKMISSKITSLAAKISARFISDFAGSQSAGRIYPRSFSVVRNDVFFSLAPVNVIEADV